MAVTEGGRPLAAAVVEFAGGPGHWVERRYSAALGLGAAVDGVPLQPSAATQLRRALLATGFGYDHGADWEANMGLWRHFTDRCQGVRRLGAASVDLAHVGLGILDGYWEFQLKPWDMAAGALLISEAGGIVTRGDGRPFSVFSRSIAVAATPALHAALLDAVCPATLGLAAGPFPAMAEDWFVPDGYRLE